MAETGAAIGEAPYTRPVAAAGRARKVRILHSVGHLIRGGIEHWLHDAVRRLDPQRFEHHVLVWTDAEEAFTADFRAAGVKVLPCLGHTNPPLFARNLRRLVRQHGPYDVLHTHGTHYHGYVVLLAKALGIGTRVAHSHNDLRAYLGGRSWPYRAYAAAGNAAIRRFATAGLAVSEQAAASMFGAAWRADDRWRRLFCGIDLRPYAEAPDPSLRAALGIPADRFVIGHVGRFVPQKNHAFLLDIAAELIPRRPNAHFLLFGDGPGRDAFVAALRERSLADRFTLVAYSSELPAQMVGAMDGFILPSLREGLALVGIYAQAAGLPCLFSDTVSPEVIVDPARARFVPLGQGAAVWADAILGMPAKLDNRDPALRDLFQRSDFNIERSVAKLASFYEEAAAGPAARAAPRRCRGAKPTVFIAHPSDLLTDHLPNGDGLVAFGFIRELAARGYRLHVAAREVALRDPLPGDVTLHLIGGGSRGVLRERLRYMAAIRRLLRQLRRREPIDVVHQMNPVFAGLSLGLLGCGLPIVLGTFVARWPDEDRQRPVRRLRRAPGAAARWLVSFAQQRQAARLLLSTPAALDRVPLPSLSRGKIVTVHHGVDAELFAPAPRGEHEGVAPSILFYAHVDHRKGVFVLLEAFREVAQALPACRLTVVGRGDHVAEFERAVAASGCADRISLLGRVDREEAPALFRSHAVYCLPSFGEPYGMTALEAMSCGMPVVATAAGGLKHLVPPAGGYLVPPGDAKALAAALLGILTAPELRAAMGRANRAHVERHYTWEKVVDGLERVYLGVSEPEPEPEPVTA